MVIKSNISWLWNYSPLLNSSQQQWAWVHVFPSIIMGNVRSLVSKMDELTSVVRSRGAFWDASVMCFMDTWLQDNTPATAVSVGRGGGGAGGFLVPTCSERLSRAGINKISCFVSHWVQVDTSSRENEKKTEVAGGGHSLHQWRMVQPWTR